MYVLLNNDSSRIEMNERSSYLIMRMVDKWDYCATIHLSKESIQSLIDTLTTIKEKMV